MIRAPLAAALLVVSSLHAFAVSAQLIAFERGPDIWVANLDGTEAKKIATGSAPDFSPDGTRIAFHSDTSTPKNVVRQIAVFDLATKRTKVFKSEIPSENCQRAIWSPDGAHILFSIFTDSNWQLAMIGADGTGFRYVKKAGPRGNSFWSACWASDGQSIYAQDLDQLYQLALDGTELKKWSLRSLCPKGAFSSGSSFAASPDGKTLLMDVEMDEEEADLPDWDGPPSAVWTLDIESGKSIRLTATGVVAWVGCWLDPKRILFASQSKEEKDVALYRMTVADKAQKLVLKKANSPTVSRPARD